jgi:hypothetical protein
LAGCATGNALQADKGRDGNVYSAYHSAWTSIDGLRDYHYRGAVTELPAN